MFKATNNSMGFEFRDFAEAVAWATQSSRVGKATVTDTDGVFKNAEWTFLDGKLVEARVAVNGAMQTLSA